MNTETFGQILDDTILKIKLILGSKAKEYATVDRLHNFKAAASLMSTTYTEALRGMMVKHTISLYDMLNKPDPTEFTSELWDEKIIDSINYLILLRALVQDLRTEAEAEKPKTCSEHCHSLDHRHDLSNKERINFFNECAQGSTTTCLPRKE